MLHRTQRRTRLQRKVTVDVEVFNGTLAANVPPLKQCALSHTHGGSMVMHACNQRTAHTVECAGLHGQARLLLSLRAYVQRGWQICPWDDLRMVHVVVACYMSLHVACCMLHVACCMLCAEW